MTENKNIIDIMEKGFEVITNNDTSKKLLKLKKKLAKDITKKLGITNKFEKEITINYLVNEGNFKDLIGDKLKEGIFGEKGLGLKIITTQLEELRDKLDKAKTKEDLEKLRTDIFNETNSTKSGSKKASNNSSTDTNTTAQTKSPAAAGQTNTDSSTTQQGFTSTATSSTTEKAKVDSSSESYEIDHLNFSISPETKTIYENIKGKEKPDLEPFACALKVYNNVKGKIHNTKYLTVVDFTKKKGKKRFFVINMENNTVEYAVKVGHGKNTGGERAKQFSNKSGSKQSSLGGYLLPDTITKSPNKSWSGLRQITGLESSNSNAAQRGIAVHPGGENGSEGCFTLPKDISKNIMEKIKGGFLFAYAESKDYFAQSKYFQKNSDGSYAA